MPNTNTDGVTHAHTSPVADAGSADPTTVHHRTQPDAIPVDAAICIAVAFAILVALAIALA